MGLSKKKVEPQFGVSFGLPYPTGAYPLNTFNGGAPAPNPYFGSISPNGLNLGLVNVNPLVSFQFAKNEYGEKLFKPLVNLHVTPNENIIQKVGNLFKAKKYGYGHGSPQGPYNQHYHTHTHFPGAPPAYHPQHYEGGHYGGGGEYFESGHGNGQFGLSPAGPGIPGGPGGFGLSSPGFQGGPGGFGLSSTGGQGGYGFSGPGNYYGASGPAGYHGEGPSDAFYPSGSGDYNYDGFYSRSLNGTQGQNADAGFTPSANNYQNVYPTNQQNQFNDVSAGYANNYNDYNNQSPNDRNQNENRQSQSVSFPSSRRKRSSGNDNVNPNQSNDDEHKSDSVKIEKVRTITAEYASKNHWTLTYSGNSTTQHEHNANVDC